VTGLAPLEPGNLVGDSLQKLGLMGRDSIRVPAVALLVTAIVDLHQVSGALARVVTVQCLEVPHQVVLNARVSHQITEHPEHLQNAAEFHR